MINNVYECSDPAKVIFKLQSGLSNSNIFLVWSLQTNTEIRNFSASGS